MKNGKKIFILVETFLGLMVFVLVMFMFLEKNEKKQEKISVIIQNSDDSQWAAFKYGAKMAAADKKTEVFVVSNSGKSECTGRRELNRKRNCKRRIRNYCRACQWRENRKDAKRSRKESACCACGKPCVF